MGEIKGDKQVSCPYDDVSGLVAVWSEDNDCDIRTESGDRLSGRCHASNGKVLLEVRMRKWFMFFLSQITN